MLKLTSKNFVVFLYLMVVSVFLCIFLCVSLCEYCTSIYFFVCECLVIRVRVFVFIFFCVRVL